MRDPFRLPEPPAGPNTSHVVTNQAVIQSQRPLTHDTDELVTALRPGSAPLHARAGQFATIKFTGIQRARPYYFARDPWAGTATEFTFYIRRITGGEVSDWLAQQNRRGAAVELTGPLGRFGIDESTGSMLCVAGGSGMSAVIALLEYAAAKQVRRDCYFFLRRTDVERSVWHGANRYNCETMASRCALFVHTCAVRRAITQRLGRPTRICYWCRQEPIDRFECP